MSKISFILDEVLIYLYMLSDVAPDCVKYYEWPCCHNINSWDQW